jgi:hypothetical protein
MASQTIVGVAAATLIFGVVALGTAVMLRVPGASVDTGGPPGADAAGLGVLMPASGIPQCDGYRAIPDTYGYCLYKLAGGLPDIDSVNRICALAGDWEGECRHAWVAGKMNADSPYAMDELLEVCGENDDCAFELLDFRPADLVDDQLERCRLHAGKHADNCTGHAMQRWKLRGVDAEEVARVAAMPTAFPRKVGFWIAASVQCDGVGTCEGNGAVQAACEGQSESFTRKPERCPANVKAPLQPGKTAAGAVKGRSPGVPQGGGGVVGGGPATSGPSTPGEPLAEGGPGTPAEGSEPGTGGPKTPTPPVHHQPGTIPSGLPPRPR